MCATLGSDHFVWRASATALIGTCQRIDHMCVCVCIRFALMCACLIVATIKLHSVADDNDHDDDGQCENAPNHQNTVYAKRCTHNTHAHICYMLHTLAPFPVVCASASIDDID